MATPTLPSNITTTEEGGRRCDTHEHPGHGGPRPDRRMLRRMGRWAGPLVVLGLLAAAAVRFLDDPEPAARVAVPQQQGDVISGLEAAVAARPGDLGAWQQLGSAYLAQAASSGDPSYYDQAGAAFERAEQLAPGNPTTMLGRASLALSQHHFDRALELGEAALALRPQNAEALAVLVDANVELGRYDVAAAVTQQLLDVRPGMAALTRTSYQRELHGDLAGALTAMVQAEAAAGGADTAATGGDSRPLLSLATVVALEGDVLSADGRPAEAAARYQRALELAPTLALAEIGLARTDAAAGQLDAAIARLEELINRSPTLPAATLLGDLQRLAGLPATGDELVDVIVQLQRSSGATVDMELAVHLADRGRPDLDLALAAYTERPSIYGADVLGWSLTRAGRGGEALPYVEQALSLGTEDAVLHFHAAMAYDAAGRRDLAARELQSAFDTNPYFTFGLRAEATELAGRLAVAVPAAWTN